MKSFSNATEETFQQCLVDCLPLKTRRLLQHHNSEQEIDFSEPLPKELLRARKVIKIGEKNKILGEIDRRGEKEASNRH